MPIIRLGGGVQDARGSLGGQTVRKGRSGHLLQSRRGPVNKQSARQSKSRTIFRQLTQYWSKTLSNVQRASWKIYGDAIDTENRLGQSVHLTGFHHFIAYNSLRLQFGDPIVNDGPTVLTLPGQDPTAGSQINFVTQQLITFFDESQPWVADDNGRLYLTMSQPKTVGTQNFNKSFRLAGVINGSSSSPPTSPQETPTPYPIANGCISVCKIRIAEGDGRLSNFFRFAACPRPDSNAYSFPVGLC